jgi:hypothetical protein
MIWSGLLSFYLSGLVRLDFELGNCDCSSLVQFAGRFDLRTCDGVS